jgi:hypothetical protein
MIVARGVPQTGLTSVPRRRDRQNSRRVRCVKGRLSRRVDGSSGETHIDHISSFGNSPIDTLKQDGGKLPAASVVKDAYNHVAYSRRLRIRDHARDTLAIVANSRYGSEHVCSVPRSGSGCPPWLTINSNTHANTITVTRVDVATRYIGMITLDSGIDNGDSETIWVIASSIASGGGRRRGNDIAPPTLRYGNPDRSGFRLGHDDTVFFDVSVYFVRRCVRKDRIG